MIHIRKLGIEPLETRIAPAFVTGVLDLSSLNGANGTQFNGGTAGDLVGQAVASAGDVNGDGLDDFIIGAPDSNGTAGGAYVIFGRFDGFEADISLAGLTADQGFALVGENAGDRAGVSVGSAGDFNGDGFDDILIGATGANTNDGKLYVVFGQAGTRPAFHLSSIVDGTGLIIEITGASGNDARLGRSVGRAGDFNGDGFDDLIVGAPTSFGFGDAFIYYGSENPTAIGLQRTTLLGLSAATQTGISVSAAGDVNGDGIDDVIVGAKYANEGGAQRGAAYVVFGKTGDVRGTLNLADLLPDGNGVQFSGTLDNDYAGASVSGAGDVNGDGFADVIVGAYGADGQQFRGAAYVVLGSAAPVALTLGALNGTNGFRVGQPVAGGGNPTVSDFLGYSVSVAGDVNGDGLDDLLIGAKAADPAGRSAAGQSYVVFGRTSAFPAILDPSTLTNFTGIIINGEFAGDRSGTAVSSAGDVNGDTFADLLVGAPEASPNGAMSGQAYLIYGGPSGEFVAPSIISGGKSATFTDVDGDLVTVKVSKGTLTGSEFVLLKSSATAVGAQLLSLNLGATFDGADVSITAKRVGGGDGRVNVGLLNAGGVDLGKVTVGGDLGRIAAGDTVNDLAAKSLTVGSLGVFGGRTGDTGIGTRSEVFGAVGLLKVAGDVGGRGFHVQQAVGAASGGDLASVSVGGSLLGGKIYESGSIIARDRIGTVKVAGDLRGGAGDFSGLILGFASVGNVAIGGSLLGGGGTTSGAISGGTLGNVNVGGSQIGGDGVASGAIGAQGNMGKVSIKGDQFGGGAVSAGLIFTTSPDAKIASVTIGGDVRSGTAQFAGGILATGALGPVTIGGDVIGTVVVPYLIRGAGPLTGAKSVAVASVKVGGDLEHALILGGYGSFNTPVNGRAQIGAISVGGDWIASSVTAGVMTNADATNANGIFGNGDDAFIPVGDATNAASIKSITIKGTARGTFEDSDRFAIVAEQIGSVSIGGVKLPLTKSAPGADPANDLAAIPVGATLDFVVREVSRTTAPPAPAFTAPPAAGPRTAFPAEIDLGTLASADGFKLSGVAGGDRAGGSVREAGDVNGDGFDDFIVGAYFADEGGDDLGAAYVVFGQAGGLGSFNLSALDGANGFKLRGVDDNDLAGRSVSAAGDVNGDGFADLIVGARFADLDHAANATDNRGAAYVVFGRSSFASVGTAGLALSALDGTDGFKMLGAAAGDDTGISVGGAGDVNGDGFDDVIVGAPSVNGGTGAAYVVFGKSRFTSAPAPGFTIGLSTLAATDGFILTGENPDDVAGRQVSGAGDVNGDGFDDVIVGVPNHSIDEGAAYVVFGREDLSGTIGLGSLQGTAGVKFTGVATYDFAGVSVGAAGDVNGDGFDDVIVGAYGAGNTGSSGTGAGAAYVIFGRGNFVPGPVADFSIGLGTLDGATGFRLGGVAVDDYAGIAASGAGDVNGDGFADLIVGASQADEVSANGNSGAAYVVFGQSRFIGTPVAGFSSGLSTLDGANGFKLTGEEGSSAGRAVSAAGDVNGDGFGDVLVGAPFTGASSDGAAYVVYGGPGGEFIDPTFSADFRTATWTDVDGDLVTLKVSKGTLDASNFKLLAESTADDRAQILSLTVGTAFGTVSEFDSADITLTAKRAGGGDGKVNLGDLNAANTDLGKVTISGDLGRILVGDADDGAALKSLTLGSLGVFGGLTQDTGGGVFSVVVGPIGAVKIAGDVQGAQFFSFDAATAGSGRIASLTVGGSVLGGSVRESGVIGAAGALGSVKIGGDLIGGSGATSGYIQAASLTSLTIGGDLRGSGGGFSGGVQILGSTGKVTIGGSLVGGSGSQSGLILVFSGLSSLTLGGSMLGGSGDFSGTVQSFSGLGNITIGGSQRGGDGVASAAIFTAGSIGKISIKGDQVGGKGEASALIFANGGSSNIASVAIGGDARGGDAAFSGGILAGGTLGPVSIRGDVIGTAEHAYTIRGSGPVTVPTGVTKSVAIASLKVGGDFERALILAGYGEDNEPTNGHAQIGAISIGGDWIASSVTAGLLPRSGAPDSIGVFGNGDDVFIAGGPAGVIASIASITIKGRAVGTLETGDHFGIVAEQIGSVRIGGVKLAFTAGTDAGFFIGDTPDFAVFEVARV